MKKPEIYTFDCHTSEKGHLAYLEELKGIPFEVKRVYWLSAVPEQQLRGDHAHKTGEQVIVCLQGQIEVLLESVDGELFNCTLKESNKGVYIPPMWWGKMIFSKQAIMLGLASDEFSEEDYIRNRADFK